MNKRTITIMIIIMVGIIGLFIYMLIPRYPYPGQPPQRYFLDFYCDGQSHGYEENGQYYLSYNEWPEVYKETFRESFVGHGIIFEHYSDYLFNYPNYPLNIDVTVTPNSFTVISVKNIDSDQTPNVWAINEKCDLLWLINDFSD